MEGESSDLDSGFVALLTEHQQSLRLYVASLMPGESRSADVAQQANATIWKKRDDFELGTNFKAWMFSIARYEVLNFRKKQARDSRLVFSEELVEVMAEEMPEMSDDWVARQSALKGCMAELRSADRELLMHRYEGESPLHDFAVEKGRSVGGLKVTLHRLRARLQQCIERKISMKEVGLS
ncbi:MAG: sigma-70 family RNA polymerase sigma factor [Verrucomicrobiota bacterium]